MSKRPLCIFGTLLLSASLTQAQSSPWIPDKAHSGVDFSVLHMSLSNVRGHFGNMVGTIILDESDIAKSSVNITIDVNTVDTGVAARDGDLKGANFFDVAQFPTASFLSTSIAKNGNTLTVSGNLTLQGVTKPWSSHCKVQPDLCLEWTRSRIAGSQLQRPSAVRHLELLRNSPLRSLATRLS
jgi:polyisoprenoid-binding protein YceI